MNTVGNRIRHVRTLAGLTQKMFGERLSVTSQAVSQWERNEPVSFANLSKISEFTGASFDWLRTGAGSPPAPGASQIDTSAPAPQHPHSVHEEAVPYSPERAPRSLRDAIEFFQKDRPDTHAFIVKSNVLGAANIQPGDVVVMDRSLADFAKAGDVVRAQVLDDVGGATTIFRIFQPPYLVTGKEPLSDAPGEHVDGENVQIVAVMTELVRMR